MLGKMGLVKAIFNIGFSILRTLLFGVPTLIFKQVKATSSKVFKGALSGLRLFGNWKPFKNDEKCFLFHLKSSQDI